MTSTFNKIIIAITAIVFVFSVLSFLQITNSSIIEKAEAAGSCGSCGGGGSTGGGGSNGGGGGSDHSNPPICNVSLSATSVAVGDHYTLTWNGTPSTGVFKINNYAVSDSGSAQYTFPEGYSSVTYVMTGTNSGGNCVKQVVVTKKVVEVAPVCNVSLSATSVAVGGSYTLTWNGTPSTGVFKINNNVVADSGSATYTFVGPNTETFTFSGTNGPLSCTKTVTINKIATPAPTCVLNVNPSSINVGGTAKITWTSTNAVTGSIDNSIGSVKPNNTDGFRNVTPVVNTTYTMTVVGTDGKTATCAKTVTVVPVTPTPVCTLDANPTSIVNGNSSTLTWSSVNAVSASINQSIGSVAVNGNRSVTPSNTTTYTMTVTGSTGLTATCAKTITVTTVSTPAPTCDSFTASPYTINRGSNSTLAWNTTNASSVTINNGVGSVSVDGNFTVSPLDTVTYLLTATGNGKTVTCPVTVNVTTPNNNNFTCANNVNFTANDYSIKRGDNVNLNWSTNGVTSLSINNGVNATSLSGSYSVNPTSDTTYTLTATNGSNTISCPVTINVSTPSGGGGHSHVVYPTCKFDASATSINLGDRVTLKWDTTYTDAVNLKDNFGKTLIDTDLVSSNDRKDLFDGELTVRPERTTTYTLLALRGREDRTCTVTVNVGNSVVVTQVRDQQPLVSGIALTQVPYTGFEAGPIMASIFYTLLAAWALYMAYVLVGRKTAGLSEFTPATVATDSVIPSQMFVDVTPAPVFHNMEAGVVASTATVGYAAHTEITDAIEATAHAQKVQLSHDAVAYFVAATDEADRAEILANLLVTAKASYPTEDGWVVVTAERMLALANS